MVYSNPRINKKNPYTIDLNNEDTLGGEEGNESDDELIRAITSRDELASKTVKEITDVGVMRSY